LEGLEGLSIERLADHVGMSKSGVYAQFDSKEVLQLATIDTAWELFSHEVVRLALDTGSRLARLRALCEEFLAHLERDVFPGGSFFAAAELDTRHGPVRDRVAHFLGQSKRNISARAVASAVEAQGSNATSSGALPSMGVALKDAVTGAASDPAPCFSGQREGVGRGRARDLQGDAARGPRPPRLPGRGAS
jgi:AcrR family transcriptional regulator